MTNASQLLNFVNEKKEISNASRDSNDFVKKAQLVAQGYSQDLIGQLDRVAKMEEERENRRLRSVNTLEKVEVEAAKLRDDFEQAIEILSNKLIPLLNEGISNWKDFFGLMRTFTKSRLVRGVKETED